MEPTTQRREAARRGRTDSDAFNNFQDDVIHDLQALGATLGSNTNEIARALQILVAELRASRERAERLEERMTSERLIRAQSREAELYVQEWRRTRDIGWGTGGNELPVARRMRVDPAYGQAILPFNESVDRFWYRSLDTGEVITDPGISITVNGTSESGATRIVTGTPANAFNSINESYWIREVLYEPRADIPEVECTFTASVPITRVMSSNMLVIHPYPVGLVDITGIWYSVDTSDPTIPLTTFYPNQTFPINNAGFLRFVFPAADITKIRVGLRQRNFTGRGGYKSFQYGLQELALRLVDYDRTSDTPESNPNPADNNGVVTAIDCVSGYVFSQVTGFWSDPSFDTVSDASQWPVYYKIYTDAGLANMVWDSYNDPLPQDTSVDVSAARTSTLYVLATCAYDTTRAVPPVLERFSLRHTTEV